MCTVLLLEDNEFVLAVLQRMLPSKDYAVLTARDGHEALLLHKQSPDQIDLLIADQFLPGPTGAQVAASIRKHQPNIPVLFLSALPIQYWSEADQATVLEFPSGSFGFVQKPFLAATLFCELERLIKATVGTQLFVRKEVVN